MLSFCGFSIREAIAAQRYSPSRLRNTLRRPGQSGWKLARAAGGGGFARAQAGICALELLVADVMQDPQTVGAAELHELHPNFLLIGVTHHAVRLDFLVRAEPPPNVEFFADISGPA